MNKPASVVGRSIGVVLSMSFLGLVSGVVWVLLAEPARWEARDNGIVLTEAASAGQFSVIVLFTAIGAVASLVWGSVIGWWLRDLGWVVTTVVVGGTLLAAVIAWGVGVMFGPPSPASVTGLVAGDRVPAQLTIDSVVPFLFWPVFGLVGLVAVSWIDRRLHETDEIL